MKRAKPHVIISGIQTLLAEARQFTKIGRVVLATLVGIYYPAFGARYSALIHPIVAVLIYFSISDVSFDRRLLQSNGNNLVAALGISYVPIPMVTVGLASVFVVKEYSLGFFVMAAATSTAGSAIVWTRLARSDVRSTTVISAVSIFAAPVVMPLLLIAMVGRDVHIAFLLILLNLIVVLGAGIVMRYEFGSRPIGREEEGYLTRIGIAPLIYLSISSSEVSQLSTTTILRAVLLASVIVLTGWSLAHLVALVGIIQRGVRDSVFFSSTLKNHGVSLLVAASFSARSIVTTIAIYFVVQQGCSSFLVELSNRNHGI